MGKLELWVGLSLGWLAQAGCGHGGDGVAPTPPAPTLPALASRTEGVAPLYVFFDARALTELAPPDLNGLPGYVDLRYEWDFGDSEAGNWGTNGLSKNSDRGYLSAHVFERPGSYTVNLSAKGLDGTAATRSVTITVTDPDAVYAGTATTCVSTRLDFDGCPSGASQLTTSDLSEVRKSVGDGKRVLLRRGDSWTVTDSMRLATKGGPLTVGAFGACVSPDALGICANAPLIYVDNVPNSNNDNFAFFLTGADDLRLMDLTFQGDDKTGAIGGLNPTRFLMLRVRATAMRVPFGWNYSPPDPSELTAVVSCEGYGQGTATDIAFLGGQHISLLGNDLRDASSHVVRVFLAHPGVIAHNTLSGASSSNTTGRHALKLHSPYYSGAGHTTSGSGFVDATQSVVIHDNLIGSSGPWPVSIGPENCDPTLDEWLQDILVERNRFYSSVGIVGSPVGVSLHATPSYVTVRNNIFSAENAAKGYSAVGVGQGCSGMPSSGHFRIFNNTVYIPEPAIPDQSWTGVFVVEVGTIDTSIKNNLVQMTGAATSGPLILNRASIDELLDDHNLLTATAGFVDVDNTDPLKKDLSLLSTSTAVDTGTEVPVFDDFGLATRPAGAGYDIGAFER